VTAWEVWLASMWRAAVSGGANSISAMIVAPNEVNFAHPSKIVAAFGAGAFLALVFFFQKSPLPDGIGTSEYSSVTVKGTNKAGEAVSVTSTSSVVTKRTVDPETPDAEVK
jgi:hypothetical protein